MLGGVVEHARADAVLAPGALEHVVVHATGVVGRAAAFPVLIVLRELGERHGHVAQHRVDAHDGAAARQAEDFGVRPAQAAQREGCFLDARGQVMAAELGHHDEARVGHVVFVLPAFDVAEAGELLAFEGDDGFAFFHLRGQVFVRARGDARAAHLGGFGDGVFGI